MANEVIAKIKRVEFFETQCSAKIYPVYLQIG